MDFTQLLAYGFALQGENYIYSISLLGGQFVMEVIFPEQGKGTVKVVDNESGEKYILYRFLYRILYRFCRRNKLFFLQ